MQPDPHAITVRPGQVLTADMLNRVGMLAARTVSTDQNSITGPSGAQLVAGERVVPMEFAEITEDMVAWGDRKEAESLLFDNTVAPATMADRWDKYSPRTFGDVNDPQAAVWLAGERVALMWEPTGRKRIPVPGVRWQLAKVTTAFDGDGIGAAEIWRNVAGTENYEATGITVAIRDWTKSLTLAVGDAIKIDPLDPFPGLVEEAIRRAEVKLAAARKPTTSGLANDAPGV